MRLCRSSGAAGALFVVVLSAFSSGVLAADAAGTE